MSIRITLTIEEESPAEFDFDAEDTARAVCAAVLNREHCPIDTEISLLYVDSVSIREINEQTRGIDSVTDVLSFPNLEFETPSDWSGTLNGSSAADVMNPETGNLYLGDIVLNLDRVREQAQLYGHTERREFAFLIAHSMLHLCGYDHRTKEEETMMFGKQEALLRELGIPRSNLPLQGNQHVRKEGCDQTL